MMMYDYEHEHTQGQLRANSNKLLGAGSDVLCWAAAKHLSLLCRLMWSPRMLRCRSAWDTSEPVFKGLSVAQGSPEQGGLPPYW